MKFWGIIALIFLPFLGLAQEPDVSQISDANIADTLRHMLRNDAEQKKQLDAAKAALESASKDNLDASKRLADVSGKLAEASAQTVTLTNQIADLTAWGVAQQSRADKAEADLEKTKAALVIETRRANLRAWFIGALAGIAAALTFLRMFPTFAWWGAALAFGGGFGLAMLLVHRFL